MFYRLEKLSKTSWGGGRDGVATSVPEDCMTTVAKATFVIVSTWQGNSKLILRIMQIVRSNHGSAYHSIR